MDREGGEDVLDGVVRFAEGNEMLEESSGGKCCNRWEGCDAVFKCGECRAKCGEEFVDTVCSSLKMVWGMSGIGRFVSGRRGT